MGAKTFPRFDISAGCAGFGYALGVAADMIRGGSARNMLVIGTEKLSPTVDMHDRSNCFIFADGAAAVVVGETPIQGIGPTVWGSDGEQANAIRQDIDWITFAENPSGPRPFCGSRARGLPLGGIPDGRSRSTGDGRSRRQTQ